MIAAFIAYTLLGNDISPEVAFTTMSVVRLFEGPIFGLPNAVNELVQIFTSLKRIEKFLFAKEINSDHLTLKCERDDNAVEITDGDFYFKR